MEIIGHKRQWEYLKRGIENGRVAHAYLFYGPSKIGKRTVALEFAKLLNCYNSNTKACGRCISCQEIEKDISANLLLISATEPGEEKARPAIHIKQIRDLKSRLYLTSANSGHKIAVINEASILTFDAQGALLKLLEEPKGKTVIILIAEHPNQLLPTIVSRCQPIRFALLQSSHIQEYLRTKIPLKRAREISWLSFGKPGLALDYVNNSQDEEFQKARIKEIVALTKAPLNIRFQYAERLSRQRTELQRILEIWLNFFRELLLEKLGSKKPFISSQKDPYSLKRLKNIINIIEKIRFVISATNVNPRLALEVLLMRI